jgi:hypothetical protein
LHERSAQADIAFSVPRIHLPGKRAPGAAGEGRIGGVRRLFSG